MGRILGPERKEVRGAVPEMNRTEKANLEMSLQSAQNLAVERACDAMDLTRIKRFADALPHHAEEGPYRESVSESDLIKALKGKSSASDATVSLALLRRLYESLCLLDSAELQAGRWAFVSFPANLLGRSIAETLSTPGQQLFDPGYWQQGSHRPVEDIDDQRAILEAIESARVRLHPKQNPAPVRKVYVAWGIVRLGFKYLLYKREALRPIATDYVFPGGRMLLDDLPPEFRNETSLRRLHNGDMDLATQGLPTALERELREELKLDTVEHYRPVPFCNLAPYSKVSGKDNHIAYSEYFIAIYAIHLRPEGESRLLSRVSTTPELVWFSKDDLLAVHGRPDGKAAFIDVLRHAYGDSLGQFFESIPDSSGTPYRLSGEKFATDIPNNPEQPFRTGKTGKEEERNIALSGEQLALLRLLLAESRGLDLNLDERHVKALGGGWIQLLSPDAIRAAKSLALALDREDAAYVAVVGDQFARLAIDPNIAYFAEKCFSYTLNGHNLTVTLNLNFDHWAKKSHQSVEIDLDPTLVLVIREIAATGRIDREDPILEASKNFERELLYKIDSHLKSIGLRKLIRTDRDFFVIGVPQEHTWPT